MEKRVENKNVSNFKTIGFDKSAKSIQVTRLNSVLSSLDSGDYEQFIKQLDEFGAWIQESSKPDEENYDLTSDNFADTIKLETSLSLNDEQKTRLKLFAISWEDQQEIEDGEKLHKDKRLKSMMPKSVRRCIKLGYRYLLKNSDLDDEDLKKDNKLRFDSEEDAQKEAGKMADAIAGYKTTRQKVLHGVATGLSVLFALAIGVTIFAGMVMLGMGILGLSIIPALLVAAGVAIASAWTNWRVVSGATSAVFNSMFGMDKIWQGLTEYHDSEGKAHTFGVGRWILAGVGVLMALSVGFISAAMTFTFILALPAKFLMLPVLAAALGAAAPIVAPIAAIVIGIVLSTLMIFSIVKLASLESFSPAKIFKSIAKYFKSKFGKGAEDKANKEGKGFEFKVRKYLTYGMIGVAILLGIAGLAAAAVTGVVPMIGLFGGSVFAAIAAVALGVSSSLGQLPYTIEAAVKGCENLATKVMEYPKVVISLLAGIAMGIGFALTGPVLGLVGTALLVLGGFVLGITVLAGLADTFFSGKKGQKQSDAGDEKGQSKKINESPDTTWTLKGTLSTLWNTSTQVVNAVANGIPTFLQFFKSLGSLLAGIGAGAISTINSLLGVSIADGDKDYGKAFDARVKVMSPDPVKLADDVSQSSEAPKPNEVVTPDIQQESEASFSGPISNNTGQPRVLSDADPDPNEVANDITNTNP